MRGGAKPKCDAGDTQVLALAEKYGIPIEILDAPVTRNGVPEERPSLDSLEKIFKELRRLCDESPHYFTAEGTLVNEVQTRAGSDIKKHFKDHQSLNGIVNTNVFLYSWVHSSADFLITQTTPFDKRVLSSYINAYLEAGRRETIGQQVTSAYTSSVLTLWVVLRISNISLTLQGTFNVTTLYDVRNENYCPFHYVSFLEPVVPDPD